MYKIWFKFKLGPAHKENCAIFDSKGEAGLAWDLLNNAGWYMMSARP